MHFYVLYSVHHVNIARLNYSCKRRADDAALPFFKNGCRVFKIKNHLLMFGCLFHSSTHRLNQVTAFCGKEMEWDLCRM